jgi:hypothetical protein
MTAITGECFCGGIGYEIEGPLAPARSCHCSRCRKAFSGAGSAMSRVDPKAFTWTRGEDLLQTYINREGIGLGFCRRCGTTLCGLAQGAVMGITLGTLNGDPAVTIGQHIFVGSKAGWDEIGGDAPQCAAWPDPEDEPPGRRDT